MRVTIRTRTVAALAIAVGLSFSLTACGDDEAAQETVSGSGGGASTTDGEVTADDDLDDGDAASDDGDTDPAQVASPTSCLVGTWLADNQHLGALFKDAAAGTDAAGSLSDPTGSVLVTFGAQGEYSVTYDAWTMSMSQDGMTMELIRNGTDEGGYEATDAGAVEWTEATMGSLATLKSPAGTMEIPGDPSGASGTFICAGEALEITVDGDTTAFDRQS